MKNDLSLGGLQHQKGQQMSTTPKPKPGAGMGTSAGTGTPLESKLHARHHVAAASQANWPSQPPHASNTRKNHHTPLGPIGAKKPDHHPSTNGTAKPKLTLGKPCQPTPCSCQPHNDSIQSGLPLAHRPRQAQPRPLPCYYCVQNAASLPPGCELLLRHHRAAPPQPR